MRRTLAELDREREEHSAAIAAHESGIVDRRRKFNELTLPAQLPLETLTYIFLLATRVNLPNPAEVQSLFGCYAGWYAAMLPIMGVCYHWRTTIISFPKMWERIPVTTRPQVERMMTLSKDMPLGVYIDNAVSEDMSAIQAAFDALHRAEELSIVWSSRIPQGSDDDNDDDTDMPLVTDTRLTPLKSLALICPDQFIMAEYWLKRLERCIVEPPKLEVLHLQPLTTWTCPLLQPDNQKLTHLTLINGDPNSTASRTYVLSVLRGLENLKYLKIENALPRSFAGNTTNEEQPVKFPKLETLVLDNNIRGKKLLSLLWLPEATSISLGIRRWDEELYKTYMAVLSRNQNGDNTQPRIKSASLYHRTHKPRSLRTPRHSIILQCWPTFRSLEKTSVQRPLTNPPQLASHSLLLRVRNHPIQDTLRVWPPSFASNLESFTFHVHISADDPGSRIAEADESEALCREDCARPWPTG